MSYFVKITPHDTAEPMQYHNYKQIQECVNGHFERCGTIPPSVFNEAFPYDVYCNEEFLLSEEFEFNALASLICGTLIYGNAAVLATGYDDEGVFDNIPMSEDHALFIKNKIESIAEEAKSRLDMLRDFYIDNKPEPEITFRVVTKDELEKALGI